MLVALTINFAILAAIAAFGWWRKSVKIKAYRLRVHGEQIASDKETYRLSLAIAEARRLLADKRAHGRVDATRGAWEAERDRWMEATK